MINKIKKYFRKLKNRKILYIITLIIVWAVGYIFYFRYFGALPQATSILFQEIAPPVQSDIILVFSPHEDDETLGVGGYISRAISNNAKVYVVFATDGNRRNKKILRYQESLTATAILGVPNSNVTHYDYPDMKLSGYQNQLRASINKSLDDIKPNIVFTSSTKDTHPDHSYLGAVVADAVKERQNISLYSYLIHYKAYPRPQAYKPHNSLLPPLKLINTTTIWQKYSLDSDSFDKKSEAVLEYKSQLSTPFLHSLMKSFIRQNEIFVKEN